MPPDPKPLSRRRRRNADPTAAEFVGEPAVKPVLRGEFLPETVEWWDAVWDSPMSAIWLASDAPEIVLLARLQDLVNRGEVTATLLGEIRQLKDRYGLSPLARRRLAWEIKQAVGGEDVGELDQGERWLRAVSS